MKIAVFGATGRTGRPLVEQALAEGHDVTVLVRDPSRLNFAHDRLHVVQGDVHDPDSVERAVAGQDAVISTIGFGRTSGKDVLKRSAESIVAAMRKHGVRRLVTVLGAGARDPRDPPRGLGGRFMIGLMKTLVPHLLEDAQGHAAAVRASGLDWTIVRPPRLGDGPKRGRLEAGYMRLGPQHVVHRSELADFLLRAATEGLFVGEAPMVAPGGTPARRVEGRETVRQA